ncbi:MAG: GNAT family N-acetyltransferase [Chloroflexi bacterium]|nr:GNAT family N-acetyltransferase [Chloroflexota bacterium]
MTDSDLGWAADVLNAACVAEPGYVAVTPAELARQLRPDPNAEVVDTWAAVQDGRLIGWTALVHGPRLLAARRAHLLGPFAMPGASPPSTPQPALPSPRRQLIQAALAVADTLPIDEVHTWFEENDAERVDLVHSAGFQSVRSFCHLGVELTAAAPESSRSPDLPIDLISSDEDWIALADVKNRSFAESWGHAPATAASMRAIVEKTAGQAIVLLAWHSAEPVGFCWALVPAQAPNARSVRGWIENLGVVPEHRNRRIGWALLLAGFHHLYAAGATWAGLAVDASNTPALRLYRNAGMRPLGTTTVYVYRYRCRPQ